MNRVLVDVVVTDAHGRPVHGLTKSDFAVEEDGRPQTVLSFDAFDFDKSMDYQPPSNMPALPPHTFVNLPATPERGPLYVLFYDMVNIPQADQIPGRAQLAAFVRNKPEGARFAIFVSSDGVHIVQGFTSDKQELLAAIDPKSTRPHVPAVFLMGVNFGEGDRLAAALRLDGIAQYLAPLPGRKNIIWFASEFPLALFPGKDAEHAYVQEAKNTIDLLAKNQIAVYPVDTSALPASEVYSAPGDTGGGSASLTTDVRDLGIQFPKQPSALKAGVPGDPVGTFKGAGASQTEGSYQTQDEIAQMTGGRAIYSSNDLTGALEKVTEMGGNYYTLSYSPSDKGVDGRLRHIGVQVKSGDYHLAYRRGYYAAAASETGRAGEQELSASMQHGAPEQHQLIFGVHVGISGGKRKSCTLDYTVMSHQFLVAGDTAPRLELAAATYDSDGGRLSSIVNQAAAGEPSKANAYRVQQELAAPADARFLRIGVRNMRNGMTGAMEISLPLAR